jgi:hypothetical protein
MYQGKPDKDQPQRSNSCLSGPRQRSAVQNRLGWTALGGSRTKWPGQCTRPPADLGGCRHVLRSSVGLAAFIDSPAQFDGTRTFSENALSSMSRKARTVALMSRRELWRAQISTAGPAWVPQ